jgi:hypothetical protein
MGGSRRMEPEVSHPNAANAYMGVWRVEPSSWMKVKSCNPLGAGAFSASGSCSCARRASETRMVLGPMRE